MTRRVIRTSLLILVGAAFVLAPRARAQAPSAPSADVLGQRAAELASDDTQTRTQAFEFLSHLPANYVDATQARAALLARRPLQLESSEEAIGRIRHAMGSRRADDMVDIAPGVLPTLAERRDRETCAMAERIALMRSMEELPGRAAGRALLDLLALDIEAERWERRRVLHRKGLELLPTLLDGRSHPSPAIRRWVRNAIPAMEASDAGHVVRALASRPALLADTLMAWADARDFDAMPVVVTFIDADDNSVREAARDAMRAYAQNGIWMLRRQYRTSLGEDASTDWGWRRTYDELVTRLDARRLAPARDAMTAGLAAAEAGDLAAMRDHFDEAARLAPRLEEQARMAPGYARWASAAMEAGHFEEARRAFLRASRLTDDEDAAEDLRARALLAEAEAERQAGIVDVDAYHLVTQLSPGQALASQRLAESTTSPSPEWGPRQQTMLAGAALAVFGLLLIFGRQLPAVDLARRAARAGARMATSAGRTLRAHAQRSLRRPDAGGQWTRSIPLALMQAKKPRPPVDAPRIPNLRSLCAEANEALATAPGSIVSGAHSTSPGAILGEAHSTAPGLNAPVDYVSTAAGMDAPEAAISTNGRAAPVDAIHQAEALGILSATPEALDPFEDDDPFEGAELFDPGRG